MYYRNKAFSILEIMAIVFVIAILVMIALPIYTSYLKRSDVAVAQQEISRLALQLERHKSRNFSYKGFDASYLYTDSNGSVSPSFDTTNQLLYLPIGSTQSNYKYVVTIIDPIITKPLTDQDSTGQRWVLRGNSKDTSNYSLLFTNTGVKCKNTTVANITNTTCGTGSESW